MGSATMSKWSQFIHLFFDSRDTSRTKIRGLYNNLILDARKLNTSKLD